MLYVNGDWARLIQPVTDRLCEKYRLSTLSYDPEEPRAGKSYVEHMAIKNDRMTHRELIRMDIDAAVQAVTNVEDFFDFLQARGYTWRKGHSKIHGDYISYHLSKTEKGIRDYTLGEGYTINDICKRLTEPVTADALHPYMPLQKKAAVWFPGDELSVYRMSEFAHTRYQVCVMRRIDQAIRHYDYDLTLTEHIRVRQDLLHIDRYRRQIEYLTDTGYDSMEELQDRLSVVQKELKKYDIRSQGDNHLRLYNERRVIRQLIKDYEDTIAINDVSSASGKEMAYEEIIDERVIGKP